MAITRLGQVASEMRCNEEFITLANGSPSISGNHAKSGLYAVRNILYDACGIGFESIESVRAGVHFYAMSGVWSDANILYLGSSGNQTDVVFGITADYSTKTFSFYADGEVVATTIDSGLELDTWHHFSLVWTGDGKLRAWRDSESIIRYDKGSDFTNNTVNGVWSGTQGVGAETYTDNLYADYVTGSDILTVPPRKLFMFKSVTGAGTYDDWTAVNETANWRAIDDPSAHNADTDYNEALSGSLIDTFGTSPVSIPANTDEHLYFVRAIIPQLIIKRNDVSQDAGVRMVAYDGSTLKYGNDHEYIGPGYEMVWDRFEEQPDGTDWVEDDINAMEFGYQSRGTF